MLTKSPHQSVLTAQAEQRARKGAGRTPTVLEPIIAPNRDWEQPATAPFYCFGMGKYVRSPEEWADALCTQMQEWVADPQSDLYRELVGDLGPNPKWSFKKETLQVTATVWFAPISISLPIRPLAKSPLATLPQLSTQPGSARLQWRT
jgi:hypothetical protein